MFDLNKALKEWEKSLNKQKSLEDGYKEEIKSHLRDEIENKINNGKDPATAFNEAVKNIGKLDSIGKDYVKSNLIGYNKSSLLNQILFPALLINYFKVGARRIKKNKSYSLINIFGLSAAMAASLLITIFIIYELNFDMFHSKAENIYRLNEIQRFKGQSTQTVALSMFPMGQTLKQDYPEVKEFVRFLNGPDILNYNNNKIVLKKSFYVDESVLNIFDFKLIAGNKNTALNNPGGVLLTKTTAVKLFGDYKNAVEKTFNVDTLLFTVTGILEDIPQNSHLQFEALFSIYGGEKNWMRDNNNWDSNFLVTYLLLEKGSDIKKLESKFPDFLTKYVGEKATETYTLFLQSLGDIHLGSLEITHDYQNYNKFSRNTVYTFGMLALFIIIIAGINFMNISVAQSTARAKEIGIRKTMGAFRNQITKQFIGESILSTVISVVVSIIISAAAIPYLNSLVDRQLSLNVFLNPLFIIVFVVSVIMIGILSGAYPALVLSAFHPVKALKEKTHSTGKSFSLKSFLVVTQFGISTALIVATGITIKQLSFIRNRDLGFQKDQIVLVPMNDTANEKYELIKNEMLKNKGVVDASRSSQRLGNNIHQMAVRYEGINQEEKIAISNLSVDYNFLSFYGIELKEGRGFSNQIASDFENAYIINESLQNKLGWKNPIGKAIKMNWFENMGKVIGVVKDFNYNSLHNKIEPLLISVQGWRTPEIALKIKTPEAKNTIEQIKKTWEKLVADRPFEYEFLDEHFANLYKSDEEAAKIISIIAGLSILIACLGLFGLSSIIIEQKTKEIGIRKVLGASVVQLVAILSGGFIKLILIAFVLSAPATYYFMNGWLEDYAYRIDIKISFFVLAGVAALTIALLTISYRAIKTARANPVKSLKYE